MICQFPNKMINLQDISCAYLRFAVVLMILSRRIYSRILWTSLFICSSLHPSTSRCPYIQKYRSLPLSFHLHLTFGNWPAPGLYDVFRPIYISDNLRFNLRYETTQVLQAHGHHSDLCITLMLRLSLWKLQLQLWHKKCLQDLEVNAKHSIAYSVAWFCCRIVNTDYLRNARFELCLKRSFLEHPKRIDDRSFIKSSATLIRLYAHWIIPQLSLKYRLCTVKFRPKSVC